VFVTVAVVATVNPLNVVHRLLDLTDVVKKSNTQRIALEVSLKLFDEIVV
jgi:hypothetical protein